MKLPSNYTNVAEIFNKVISLSPSSTLFINYNFFLGVILLKERKVQIQLWYKLCELIAKNPDKVSTS